MNENDFVRFSSSASFNEKDLLTFELGFAREWTELGEEVMSRIDLFNGMPAHALDRLCKLTLVSRLYIP
jgi:hypothetical protein